MIKPRRPLRDVLTDWASELSQKLRRSEARILAEGLTANDFSPANSVEVRHPDGSVRAFKFAFAVMRPHRKEAAVFSEHDGYVEFDLVEDAVVAEIHEEVYRQR
jgi:hypothetical protein